MLDDTAINDDWPEGSIMADVVTTLMSKGLVELRFRF
jgi:hypothetical protein